MATAIHIFAGNESLTSAYCHLDHRVHSAEEVPTLLNRIIGEELKGSSRRVWAHGFRKTLRNSSPVTAIHRNLPLSESKHVPCGLASLFFSLAANSAVSKGGAGGGNAILSWARLLGGGGGQGTFAAFAAAG